MPQPAPPSPDELAHELAHALSEAMQEYHRSVQAFDDAVGRHLGLGPADLRCLDRLADGPSSAGALAVATGLRAAATTALIDRLEARGLVVRTRSSTDRRTVVVTLTALGEEQMWGAYGPLADAARALLDALALPELAVIRDYVQAMRDVTDAQRRRMAAD